MISNISRYSSPINPSTRRRLRADLFVRKGQNLVQQGKRVPHAALPRAAQIEATRRHWQ
jgi:hypothetical protein